MNDRTIPEEWFRFAADDLTVAKACFEDMYPKKLAIACYHSILAFCRAKVPVVI
jgi:hypothetical protein